MSIVIDASLTLAWYFEDERTDAVLSVLDHVAKNGAVVPSLWHLEVANGFLMALRRNRATSQFCDASLKDLSAFAIVTDEETNQKAWAVTLKLADTFRLAIYDACYLELAMRRGLPLATLDRALSKAAEKEGVKLIG